MFVNPLRITFGIIVLNGEPFTKYCRRALYPFAHEIIVVEGAVPAATPDGHSLDGTLEALDRFKYEICQQELEHLRDKLESEYLLYTRLNEYRLPEWVENETKL
jgi:hypothetical protein